MKGHLYADLCRALKVRRLLLLLLLADWSGNKLPAERANGQKYWCNFRLSNNSNECEFYYGVALTIEIVSCVFFTLFHFLSTATATAACLFFRKLDFVFPRLSVPRANLWIWYDSCHSSRARATFLIWWMKEEEEGKIEDQRETRKYASIVLFCTPQEVMGEEGEGSICCCPKKYNYLTQRQPFVLIRRRNCLVI